MFNFQKNVTFNLVTPDKTCSSWSGYLAAGPSHDQFLKQEGESFSEVNLQAVTQFHCEHLIISILRESDEADNCDLRVL